jgi:TRAP-type C4-dicarboxylate transport system substrate-binding protein
MTMRFSRILTTTALLAVCLGTAAANAVEIKIATLVPNQSQWMQDMRAAGKIIEDRTAGRVKLKFYGGGTQGAEQAVLRKIRIGQLHGGTFAPTTFMKQYSDINIYGLPFVFQSWDEMRYVRERMDAALEAGFTDLNLVTFGFVGSFSMVLSNEPISNHADMKGKKVWLPQGDTISYEAMKRLQLSPVALPVTDVLTGLQTGLLDIAAIPPEVAVALQWHTRVKYFTNMPVLFAMSFLAVDKRTFDKLSTDDQGIVREVLTEVYAKIDRNAPAESKNAVDALVKIGIQKVEPDAGQFAELSETMHEANLDMAREGVFTLERFEEMQKHLDEYRAARGEADASSGQ